MDRACAPLATTVTQEGSTEVGNGVFTTLESDPVLASIFSAEIVPSMMLEV